MSLKNNLWLFFITRGRETILSSDSYTYSWTEFLMSYHFVWELFHILRNISENSDNYCGKFRKSFQREKFRRFREIHRTLSKRISRKKFSENSENYIGKFQKSFQKISRNISDIFEKYFLENFENYFGKFWQLSHS